MVVEGREHVVNEITKADFANGDLEDGMTAGEAVLRDLGCLGGPLKPEEQLGRTGILS